MFTFIGRSALSSLNYFGELAYLVRDTFLAVFQGKIRWRLVFQQIVQIGYRSQLVAGATGAFTGAVFAAQLYFQMHKFGMDSSVGSVTAIALLRELGPALGGIMVAGRCGAAIAAEIGTMKVTEQVDALRALGVHPIDYLVVPRTLAMMISMPLLIAEACALGILAANFVAINVLNIPEAGYMRNLVNWVDWDDCGQGADQGVRVWLSDFVHCMPRRSCGGERRRGGRTGSDGGGGHFIAHHHRREFRADLRAQHPLPHRMIEVRDLTKSFGDKHVLCGIDSYRERRGNARRARSDPARGRVSSSSTSLA
jgi:phospholipid/cholesterol/gamma-HCH transport system permease protein